MESSKIKELAQDQQDYVVAMRREFHRSPELSGKEFHTRERLIEEIEKMGVPYEKLPGTGLIAIIEGGKPGKNKILRADIDALPLQEETENLKQPKVCVSEIPGRCHACGHDAHMAMLLGTMRILVQNKEYKMDTIDLSKEDIDSIVYEVVNAKAASAENKNKKAPKPISRKKKSIQN